MGQRSRGWQQRPAFRGPSVDALLDNRWRIYAHELSDSGDFQTGSAERTREGAGVHYDYSRQEAWAEVAHDEGTHRMAGSGGAKLSFGDFWTLRAEADTDSFDVPLRAVTGNVHGRSLDLDLGWRASELRSANIGLQRVLFSDGNQRAVLSGAWNERLWTTPRLQVSIGAEEYASSNSLNETGPISIRVTTSRSAPWNARLAYLASLRSLLSPGSRYRCGSVLAAKLRDSGRCRNSLCTALEAAFRAGGPWWRDLEQPAI